MKNLHFSNFYFFYFTSIGIIVPYWGLYLKHLGFSAMEIGELMAIILLTKVIAPNVWAALADRIAIKHGSSLSILKFATGLTLICYCFMGFVEQYWSVALVMFGYCVFWNACLPQVEAATLNHLNDDRDKYGGIRLWGSIGFIVTVMLMGGIMDSTGPAVILPAGAVSLFAMFVSSFWLIKRAGQQPTPNPNNKQHLNRLIPLKTLLNKRVIILLVLCFFMQISHAPFYTFFSIYLESYGYSKLHIGVLWSSGVVFEILIFVIGYRILRRYQLTKLLSFTFLVAGIRWLLVAQYPDNSSVMLLAQIMHAITYGLYHIVMIQIIDRLFVGRYQIRGQALYSSITFGLGGAVGSVLSGYVWSYYGQTTLFYAAGIMMLLVALCSALLMRKDVGFSSQKTHLV